MKFYSILLLFFLFSLSFGEGWGEAFAQSPKIKIYFTRPVDTSVSNGINAIFLNQKSDDTLVAYINRSKFTLDIAVYDLNLNGVRDAINSAYARGVVVRLVGDDNIDTTYFNALNIGGNKKKRPVSVSGAMHNKFMVIDANSANEEDAIVWTGSANFTYASTNIDANNIVIIQDKNLALAYQTEFQEMWNDTFGTYKNDNTPHEFMIDGKRVELYFSPSDSVSKKIINAINTAENDFHFAMYSFTSQNLANAIASKTSNGIFSAGMIEDTAYGTNPFNTMKAVMDSQLLIDKQSTLLHHKYAMVDEKNIFSDPLVITGSHNWTVSADTRNDENTLIIHDDTIANLFYQEWLARFKENGGSVFTGEKKINSGNILWEVKVYPNPSNGNVEFRIQNVEFRNEKLELRFYDLLGKEITPVFIRDSDSFVISKSNLVAGIYFYQIKSENKIIGNGKLIIQ